MTLTPFIQVALAWVSRGVSSPIVGFNSIERIDQGIVDGELEGDLLEYFVREGEEHCWKVRGSNATRLYMYAR